MYWCHEKANQRLWISGPFKSRCLSSRKIKNTSMHLLHIRPFILREFARRPRELEDYSQWKATEFRQFLLYTGPVILQKELQSEQLRGEPGNGRTCGGPRLERLSPA